MATRIQCISCTNSEDDPAKKINREIEKDIEKWQKQEDKVVKLLLLGIGESGKSTITKQMKIIHINGFNDKERIEQVVNIKKNVRDAILSILGGMSHLNIKLECEANEESVRYLMTYAAAERQDYPPEFFDHTSRLWQDEGVQESFNASHKYQLIDSAKYFLDRIEVIRKDGYVPSDQDVLRCRVMTNSILKIDFAVKDRGKSVPFRVFDVGGQQGERRKWIQVFDRVTAILFVVDCSCYDLMLREDNTQNRLLEAIETFERIWNNRFLRNISTIIFLNKIDLLAEKITNGKTLDMLIDSVAEDHPYYNLLQTYHNVSTLKAEERKEFHGAFPKDDPKDDATDGQCFSRSRGSSTVSNIDEEVIRTAVFIKKIFWELCKHPVQYPEHDIGSDWHSNHMCFFYYTCAVDTHTIKKVLEGCRSILISLHIQGYIGGGSGSVG